MSDREKTRVQLERELCDLNVEIAERQLRCAQIELELQRRKSDFDMLPLGHLSNSGLNLEVDEPKRSESIIDPEKYSNRQNNAAVEDPRIRY